MGREGDFLMTDTPQTAFADVEALNALTLRIEAIEAWMCRRPNDAIPQALIDQIRAEALAQLPVAPVEPAPEPETPVEPEPEEAAP